MSCVSSDIALPVVEGNDGSNTDKAAKKNYLLGIRDITDKDYRPGGHLHKQVGTLTSKFRFKPEVKIMNVESGANSGRNIDSDLHKEIFNSASTMPPSHF